MRLGGQDVLQVEARALVRRVGREDAAVERLGLGEPLVVLEQQAEVEQRVDEGRFERAQRR